jgi:hypothetical protein
MPRIRYLLATCRKALLPSLLWLTPSLAFSQTTKVCIPTMQAAKIADSLAVLPLVRREANAWKAAADSAQAASQARARANQALRSALQGQQALTANETASVELWRHRARKRGLLTYLLLGALVGSTYLFITH